MLSIRRARPEDAWVIAQQRIRMFQDNGLTCVGTWEELEHHSKLWLAKKLANGEYVGLLLQDPSGVVVGGAGVWFMEWPPHFMHLEPSRGYLLNFFVNPELRGQGFAKELVSAAEDVCRERGVKVATLHASAMGRPVYEGLEWINGNEMMKRFD